MESISYRCPLKLLLATTSTDSLQKRQKSSKSPVEATSTLAIMTQARTQISLHKQLTNEGQAPYECLRPPAIVLKELQKRHWSARALKDS